VHKTPCEGPQLLSAPVPVLECVYQGGSANPQLFPLIFPDRILLPGLRFLGQESWISIDCTLFGQGSHDRSNFFTIVLPEINPVQFLQGA